jgi:phosphopantetheine--protein transferase-like protein
MHLPPQINLYLVPLGDLSQEQNAVMWQCLSQDERERIEGSRHEKVKNNVLIARASLRHLLSRHGKLKPNEWCFDYGPQGKPSLIESQELSSGLKFNLSHSGDWLLIAVLPQSLAHWQLGVDIEHTRQSTSIHSILSRYFSAKETKDLLALQDEGAQRERFFDLWALKESYIKAHGKGLAMALDSFSFAMDEGIAIERNVTKPLINFRQLTLEAIIDRAGRESIEDKVLLADRVKLKNKPQFEANGLDWQIIVLEDTQNGVNSDHWHCAISRLDSDYRMAIALGMQV